MVILVNWNEGFDIIRTEKREAKQKEKVRKINKREEERLQMGGEVNNKTN